MKARIKESGTIVDIENLYDDGTALITDGGYIKVSKLEFLDNKDDIDWKKVRNEIALKLVDKIPHDNYSLNSRWAEAVFYRADFLTKYLMEDIK